jgi:hypothetical protein
MEKEKEAYYTCPKCKRESCIVHLNKRCIFCEQEEKQSKRIQFTKDKMFVDGVAVRGYKKEF